MQKLYIVVRQDLPPGHQATQSAHAAITFSQEHPGITSLWHRESKFLILLSVPDEAALKALARRVDAAGIAHVVWREPDWDNSVTALAIAPSPETSRLVANLPLTLREPVMV